MYHYFAMLAKKTCKNQITLPQTIVREFPDVDYFDVSTRSGAIVLHPVRVEPAGARLARVRNKIRALGLTEDDVFAATRWARAKY